MLVNNNRVDMYVCMHVSTCSVSGLQCLRTDAVSFHPLKLTHRQKRIIVNDCSINASTSKGSGQRRQLIVWTKGKGIFNLSI